MEKEFLRPLAKPKANYAKDSAESRTISCRQKTCTRVRQGVAEAKRSCLEALRGKQIIAFLQKFQLGFGMQVLCKQREMSKGRVFEKK
jgi:hypothetical protein